MTHLPSLWGRGFEEILVIDGLQSSYFELLQFFSCFHCSCDDVRCDEDQQRSCAVLEMFEGPLGPQWLKRT